MRRKAEKNMFNLAHKGTPFEATGVICLKTIRGWKLRHERTREPVLLHGDRHESLVKQGFLASATSRPVERGKDVFNVTEPVLLATRFKRMEGNVIRISLSVDGHGNLADTIHTIRGGIYLDRTSIDDLGNEKVYPGKILGSAVTDSVPVKSGSSARFIDMYFPVPISLEGESVSEHIWLAIYCSRRGSVIRIHGSCSSSTKTAISRSHFSNIPSQFPTTVEIVDFCPSIYMETVGLSCCLLSLLRDSIRRELEMNDRVLAIESGHHASQ